jgi:hypothetical protein
VCEREAPCRGRERRGGPREKIGEASEGAKDESGAANERIVRVCGRAPRNSNVSALQSSIYGPINSLHSIADPRRTDTGGVNEDGAGDEGVDQDPKQHVHRCRGGAALSAEGLRGVIDTRTLRTVGSRGRSGNSNKHRSQRERQGKTMYRISAFVARVSLISMKSMPSWQGFR